MRIAVVVSALLIGCGSGAAAPNKHTHSGPLSADEHLAEADRHTRVADSEEATYQAEANAARERCIADPVEGQSRIGGEPIRINHPCFTSVTNPTAAHLDEALDNRREARNHRRTAKALIATEERECAGLDEESKSHSPFYHREDILAVEPIVESGSEVGVEVAFKKVRGLTREWMSRALSCHQARAAVFGYKPDFMPYCPATVRGAVIEIDSEADRLVVRLRGKDDIATATILGRAERLAPAARSHDAR